MGCPFRRRGCASRSRGRPGSSGSSTAGGSRRGSSGPRRSGTARRSSRAGSLLDFGCGCGRVLRHWAGLEGPAIHGSDYNERLVGWCAANLPFVTASVNELAPPLRYEDGQFDLVYAISVFTHLPHDLERAWIDELSRITAPGGLLLLTTHGDSYADRLDADERATYDSGEPVVRWPGVAGSNLCTTFHPESYIRTRLAPGLELLEHTPDGGTLGSREQDLVVFRKPAPGTAARS